MRPNHKIALLIWCIILALPFTVTALAQAEPTHTLLYTQAMGSILTMLNVDNFTSLEVMPGVAGARWSPDGRQLALTQMDGMYIMNADGTDHRPVLLASSPAGDEFFWSADSRYWIHHIFGRERDGRIIEAEQWFSLDLEDDTIYPLTPDGVSENAVWLPAWNALLYEGLDQQTYRAHPDGTIESIALPFPLSVYQAAAPAGDYAAYITEDNRSLTAVSLNQPDVEAIVFQTPADSSPLHADITWSPDSQRLAFATAAPYHLYIADRTGGSIFDLDAPQDAQGEISRRAWVGEWIVQEFGCDDQADSITLYAVNVQTAQWHQVADLNHCIDLENWQIAPDATWIAYLVEHGDMGLYLQSLSDRQMTRKIASPVTSMIAWQPIPKA